MTNIELPYFDIFLEELAKGRRDIATAFGRHVHWGYWKDVRTADGSMCDFADAAEAMSRLVCDAAKAHPGDRVLDVGCGWGGTVASLNDRYDDIDLTGLNIDPRQLERARHEVLARPSNKVNFVEGDACRMPFEDASFDVVLAVECAFHFESRKLFFDEVKRVLKPGGRFALCDLVPAEEWRWFLPIGEKFFEPYKRKLVGPTDITYSRKRYLALARAAGLHLVHDQDVTPNTLPTYPVLRHVAKEAGVHVVTATLGVGGLEWLGRLGLLQYIVLGFET